MVEEIEQPIFRKYLIGEGADNSAAEKRRLIVVQQTKYEKEVVEWKREEEVRDIQSSNYNIKWIDVSRLCEHSDQLHKRLDLDFAFKELPNLAITFAQSQNCSNVKDSFSMSVMTWTRVKLKSGFITSLVAA